MGSVYMSRRPTDYNSLQGGRWPPMEHLRSAAVRRWQSSDTLGSAGRCRRYGSEDEESIRVLRVMRDVMDLALVRSTYGEAFGTSEARGRSHRRLHEDIK